MKISLKDSEKKALIVFIKANRKKFYRALWKWYGDEGLLLSMRDTHSSPIKTALTYFPGDYHYVAELRKIDLAIRHGSWDTKVPGIGLQELMFIHKQYWDRFHRKFVFPRTRKKMPLPHMKKTEAVKEFLARGFVHKDDFIDFRGKKYMVECTIAPLIWPEGFDLHQDACKVQTTVGISGYTKAPIPQ